ncbi:hypothetical protein P1J78_15985 [Psychromarinibacter sp. C21-152]|uniref:Uncharacterized protein n=1 Tax=Psychromarinibacter sediminicola TaxID=3033385 RepID=A0AAE3T972_9RHOB|nr:hypothetical protein [Psychromarinibacter sediminicola]MDF0602240.1 hypothetical protein [Psychromarinibacter sediminicola]
MRLVIKLILFLLVVGAVGLTGYAYLGDMAPDQQDVSEPVILDGG